jgi:hypothetical protein
MNRFTSSLSLWTKFKLLFCKRHYAIDSAADSDDYTVCVVTKNLNGVIYVVDRYIVGRYE